MAQGQDRYEREFRFFAEMCAGFSPLYAHLSQHVADDPNVMRLVEGRLPKQPASNMLFASVQYLLLSGAEHELAEFYPSVAGHRQPVDAYPVFADFCREHESRIIDLIATRRVQTNEVGRCGVLLPAMRLGFDQCDRRPLHLIEIGASAGLNLLLDRYQYRYTRESIEQAAGAAESPSDWEHCCGVESQARIHTQLRGEGMPPLPEAIPPVTGRVGIDLSPVDLRDAAAVRWIQSLIWADQSYRHELFRAAVAIARQDPPRILRGDGVDLLPGAVASVATGRTPVVFHSHCTYQMTAAQRARLDELLAELGRHRDLVHISLEWLKDDSGPRVQMSVFSGGKNSTTHLANYHSHGVWMEWLAERTPRDDAL